MKTGQLLGTWSHSQKDLNSKNKQTIVSSLKSPLTKRACKIIPTFSKLKSFVNYKERNHHHLSCTKIRGYDQVTYLNHWRASAFHCPLADEDYEDYELIFEKKKTVASLSCSQKLDWSIACSGRVFDHKRSLPLRLNYLKRCHYFKIS